MLSSGVNTRSYSLPLQRVITDFGTQNSLVATQARIKEHYGISISLSESREVTLSHAKELKSQHQNEVATKNRRANKKALTTRTGSTFIVPQTDGSMAPIVVTKNPVQQTSRKINR
jgi:ERCC4-type nuclease